MLRSTSSLPRCAAPYSFGRRSEGTSPTRLPSLRSDAPVAQSGQSGCLLSSGPEVRVLPGAPGQAVVPSSPGGSVRDLYIRPRTKSTKSDHAPRGKRSRVGPSTGPSIAVRSSSPVRFGRWAPQDLTLSFHPSMNRGVPPSSSSPWGLVDIRFISALLTKRTLGRSRAI